MSCPKCREVGYCVYCGHVNYEKGVYLSWRNEPDSTFLLENFVDGTKWILYDHWGRKKAVAKVVGDRFNENGSGRLAQYIVWPDGSKGTVYLDSLAAKPAT